MAETTIYVFAKSDISITHADGSATNNGDVIGAALNGDAFSWENPDNLAITLPTETTAITLDDKDGELTDDPYSGSKVKDQQLSESVTINGETYEPSEETLRWQTPAPVTVENEFEVVLFDADGNAYTLVGVSITEGYNTDVVGLMFDGDTPPAGTTLYYIQGQSSYTSNTGSYTYADNNPVCFLAGTLIDTPQGPRQIEDLKRGDPVFTRDAGVQPVIWLGRSPVRGLGPLAPIRIAEGALGNDRDLYVSPNHRILVRSPRAELLYGHSEVLVPAKALVHGDRIHPAPMRRADYVHILLADHEMVFAEGIASESLFTGDVALDSLGGAVRVSLMTDLPGLDFSRHRLRYPSLTPSEARLLFDGTPQRALRRAA